MIEMFMRFVLFYSMSLLSHTFTQQINVGPVARYHNFKNDQKTNTNQSDDDIFSEDVIRRRLLIDGDGTGDDRRLNVLIKSFIKWTNSSNDTPVESQILQDRMFSQLTQCEYAFTKSRMLAKMSSAELQNYENLSQQINQNIEQAKQDIEGTKEEFKEAKIVRKNRVEYEVLANIINEQPDRKQTNEKLNQLKTELQTLEEKSNQLDSKLDLRRKQFHVLTASIYQLQALLESTEDNTGDTLLDVFDDEDIDILSRREESDQMDM